MTLVDLRRTLRGGSGLFFLLVVLLVGWILLAIVTDPLDRLVAEESTRALSPAAVTQQIAVFFGPVIAWWVDAPSEFASPVVHLISARPAVMSLFLIMFAGFVPFTSCLVGCDQMAADLANRHARVILLRTGRVELMLSRFFGVVLFSAIVSLVLVLFVAAFIATKLPGFDPMLLLLWGLQGWMALVVISLPYLALTTWFSLVVRTSGMVFILSLLVTTALIVGTKILGSQLELEWLEKLSPWGWKYGLFHPQITTVIASLSVLLLFTCTLLAAARFRLVRRDC
jgi:ABC-type transport system involved in multi-copper enzyme maturation permease subunit